MDLLWLALFGAVVGPLGMFPLGWFGRRCLELDPRPDSACRVARWVHLLVIPLLLAAVFGALFAGQRVPVWRIPFPKTAGLVLTLLALAFFCVAALNLAVRGAGSPILMIFTRRLVSGGLYERTRNPIILGGFLLLLSLGLWMQSLSLILWTTGLFLPANLYLLATYEERELAIRFGDSYRQYRSRTPMLFPRLR